MTLITTAVRGKHSTREQVETELTLAMGDVARKLVRHTDRNVISTGAQQQLIRGLMPNNSLPKVTFVTPVATSRWPDVRICLLHTPEQSTMQVKAGPPAG